MQNSFFSEQENIVIEKFHEDGFVIFPLDDFEVFTKIRQSIYEWSLEILQPKEDILIDEFFDHTEKYISIENLNSFRVKLISQISKNNSTLRPDVYKIGKNHLDTLVGNELMMQRNLNLTIQMPGDVSSVLPIHSDVWDGNSPYEVVFWLPLTECYRTRSVFVLPRKKNTDVFRNFKKYSGLSSEKFFQELKNDLIWCEVPLGFGVIFSHTILHGNRINEEDKTRWAFNCRFKSIFSPFADKEAGESFFPITIRPVTRIGYEYFRPEQ